jgi:hypothetical protein
MLKRKWVMGAIVASALGAIPVVASAAIYVDVAPPEPRHEVVPAPRAGYVWAPGYYNYRHGRYVWVGGHWERERHGQYWHPGHWVERDGRYVFVNPGWHGERFAHNGYGYARNDRDHDGVPNKYDRDRDGDGVPNKYDNAPDNPYRR